MSHSLLNPELGDKSENPKQLVTEALQSPKLNYDLVCPCNFWLLEIPQ